MRLKQCLYAAILVCVAAASISGQEARKAISKPTPRYPAVAKQIGLVGTVKVEITIAPDGKIKSANVIGGHPVLVDATLTALKEWKYEPAKIETVATLTFDFHP
jgi:periplasmic protein TonB